ncbi:hypothetical protein WJX81_004757 [Elliptochloris bilobata]|uniref:RecA family profile 1 domain-containing protein n=1 Tax=Elliptochloris bilobata TaxID=381761 RepID=A0AAW1SA46_9CHLO
MPRIASLPLHLEPATQQALAAELVTVEHFLVRQEECELTTADGQQKEAFRALLLHLQSHMAAPVRNGVQLLRQLEADARILPFLCGSLDELLKGGIREGQHTELVGKSGAGKTQLCMQAAMATAARGERCAIIDTGAAFSPRRAAAMFPRCAAASPAPDGVIHAHDVHALLRHLDALAGQLQAEEAERASGAPARPRLSLLVVDSPAALVAGALGGQRGAGAGHVAMACLGRALRALARRFLLAVLTTNHVVRGLGDQPRPALGDSWANQPHVRVQLGRGEGRARSAALAAFHIGPCYAAPAWFELREDGVG